MRNKKGILGCLAVIFTVCGMRTRIAFAQDSRFTSSDTLQMEFVRVLPGQFMMGCFPESSACAAPERPARRVQITKAFEIGRYEVTQAQWQAMMGSNPSHFKGDDLPVEQVGWNDAQEFLKRLNARDDGFEYRLPTEAEWEFAARASASDSTTDRLQEVAWYDANTGHQTHRVGQKQPNAWGLHDVLGNVSEWVQDFFDLTYYSTGPSTDPTGPATGTTHVIRGGSWAGPAEQARVSYRFQMPPSSGTATIGFRCVRVPKAP
jgi:formylglycine-generating enzyme required for sulfatase activity